MPLVPTLTSSQLWLRLVTALGSFWALMLTLSKHLDVYTIWLYTRAEWRRGHGRNAYIGLPD